MQNLHQLVNQLGINKKVHRGKSKRRYAPKKVQVISGNRHNAHRLKVKKMCVRENSIEIQTQKKQDSHQNQIPALFDANCRSLNEVKELLVNVKTHQTCIVCLTETWLKELNEHTVDIPGYKLHTSNRRDRIGGGVCNYTRTDIAANKDASYTSTTTSAV